ncbi:hypothetical protein AAFN47_15995 [Hoeflea sp. CAU 1731]
MSVTATNCRVTILVKALPQPSKKYGETVCCAGLTSSGQWKRLYPIRYRHLAGETAFGRWNIITYRYRPPIHDRRAESCAVEEDSIKIVGQMPEKERAKRLNPLILPSVSEAARLGRSLALIRPTNTHFFHRQKSAEEIAEEKEAFAKAARQGSLLDRELETLEPTPHVFKFRFKDAEGEHVYTNGDWEAHAMFYRGLQRRKSATEVLDWMDHTFNVVYPQKGMAFAVGNIAKRPQTWQLLGVIRLDELPEYEIAQGKLF